MTACRHDWDAEDCAICESDAPVPAKVPVVAKHYVREWERHPDLYVFPITANDTLNGARHVAKLAAERFGFPYPDVTKNLRRSRSICYGWWEVKGTPSAIDLAANFTAGELLHELAHAWCFHRYGDHDHGQLFVCCMDDLSIWFRAHEEAQRYLFP